MQWKFPFGVAENTHEGYDFDSPEKHQSVLSEPSANQVLINRTLDDDQYEVAIAWKGSGSVAKIDEHQFVLHPGEQEVFEFNCLFAPEVGGTALADFESTKATNQKAWLNYWKNGGIIDFSECTDPRARELERRTILSQYLTKIQSTGSLPPAETGLTYNSWYGKYHLEIQRFIRTGFANRTRPRIRRCPLAKNAGARWREQPFIGRFLPDLAATSYHLACRANVSG